MFWELTISMLVGWVLWIKAKFSCDSKVWVRSTYPFSLDKKLSKLCSFHGERQEFKGGKINYISTFQIFASYPLTSHSPTKVTLKKPKVKGQEKVFCLPGVHCKEMKKQRPVIKFATLYRSTSGTRSSAVSILRTDIHRSKQL